MNLPCLQRAAMGHLLGAISGREFGRTGVLISAIVSYLDRNDAGPGFYKLAQDRDLPRGQSAARQWEFLGHPRRRDVFAA